VDFASPTQALVKVRVRIDTTQYLDYLSYHRIDDAWLITAKSFHIERTYEAPAADAISAAPLRRRGCCEEFSGFALELLGMSGQPSGGFKTSVAAASTWPDASRTPRWSA